MPTSYTGDKTQTQAPSAKPEPEGTITTRLPADGDPPNASTWAQPLKVVSDFIDWCMKPAAKATDWAKHIMAWRTAAGHKRFAIDHFGLPAGRLQHVRDDLPTTFNAIADTAGVMIVGQGAGADPVDDVLSLTMLWPAWSYKIHKPSGSGSQITFKTPDATRPLGRYALIRCGHTLNDYTALERRAVSLFDASACVALEFDIQHSGAGGSTVVAGIVQNIDNDPSTASDGAFFRSDGSGNWLAVTKNGGGANSINTGVAVNTSWKRCRIVWVGANVDDSATARALFFIDGVLVGNSTTSLPSSTALASVYFGCLNTAGGTVPDLLVGCPINIANNTWQDAI